MSDIEKYIGEAPLVESPEKKITFLLKDGAVTSSKIASASILYSHLSQAIQNMLNSFATLQQLNSKADKVIGATGGNLAGLDANGNLVDSGYSNEDFLTEHQSLANYIKKSGTSGLVRNNGSIDTSTYLTEHQDISGKANISDLALVATSGSYLDLTDKPTIPVNTNTHRTIQIEGAEILGNNITPLNFIPGSNVALTYNNNAITIAAVDTTYSAEDFDIKNLKDTTQLRKYWNAKQDKLVSGDSIKTINGISILGSGNIDISGGGGAGVPVGGSMGQVLAKKTGSDYDTEWVNQSGGGGYEPPVGGIPKTDLASDVQTSLGKADTAIQDISGKQDKIDSSHKLSADLITDGSTNKTVTQTEKNSWNGKQDAINDLSTIRSGASAGATAYQKPQGGIPATDLVSAVQTSLAKADAAALQATTYTKTEVNNLLNPIGAEIEWVTALPASGTANTIYCVQGNSSFSAYGWDGTQFVKMAEYGWIVDDEPTVGSDNLITSNAVSVLDMQINGGTTPDTDVTPTYTSGYMYTTSNNSLKITGNAGSKYSGTVSDASTPPSNGVDVSSYVGRTIKVTVSAIGATSQRETIICSNSFATLASAKEKDYVADGTAYSTELVVPANAKWLFWSGTGNLLSVAVKGVAFSGIVEKVEDSQIFASDAKDFLENAVEESDLTGVSILKKDILYHTSIHASNGGYASGYNSCTFPIRVIEGTKIHFTYTDIDISGNSITPTIRVSYYSSKDVSSFMSYGQQLYGNPEYLIIPTGAKYMIVSIAIGIDTYYAWDYYTDNAISFSFQSQNIRVDLKQELSDISEGSCAMLCKIDRSVLMRGDFDNNGAFSVGHRSVSQGMYHIPKGTDSIFCKTPNEGVYLWKIVFYDENKEFISASQLSNFERVGVVNGAQYCRFVVQKLGESYYGRLIPDTDVFYLNLDVESSTDNKNDIIFLNNEGETLSKILNVKQPAKVNGANKTVPLSLLFFTDIHGNKENLQRIIEFYDRYRLSSNNTVNIDAVLSGGDNVQVYNAEGAFSYWDDVVGAQNILNCVGNHDAAADSSLSSLEPKKDVYDLQFAPYISNWGVTQPSGASESGLMYYYKDFTTQKIRLVVLDCIYWDAAELSWFEGVLEDARTNNYSVIGVSHYPIGSTTPIQCNFLSLDYNLTGGARLTNPINAVDSFISNGGTFICWLTGHTHVDGFGTVAGHSEQLNIIVDTANAQGSSTLDTKIQDCFNIIGIDVYSKLIKVVRIGRDFDRYMRHIGEMCYSYESHEVLYSR